jgi:hypothetical protein
MARKKINRSGTIAVGGVAQNFALSRSTRKGFEIRNTSNKTLWINDLGQATMDNNSLPIKPDEYFVSFGGEVSTTTISIIGEDAGMTFFGREW